MMENGNPQEVAEGRMVENEELRQGRIGDLSNYTYCMVSTLNQMVNYLPMLLFPQMTQKLYITLNDQKGGGKNQAFDEALKRACAEVGIGFPDESDYLRLEAPYSTETVKNDIKSKICDESKVCWNITGGQRPILMAILDLVKGRKDDYIMYLEGNEGKLVVQQSNGNGCLREVDLSPNGDNYYAFEGDGAKLNIRTALQLMGFKEDINYENLPDATADKAKYYLSFRDKVIKEENLRRRLLALNKGNVPSDFCTKEVLSDPKKTRQCFSELDQEELALLLKHKDQYYPFGHLLEELFAHAIFKVAKGHIADMGVNIRLRYDDEKADKETGKKQIDELDIAILTKTGQFAVFEVKSGDMESDVAKSTKYTTYAIAGVYGKPILLTPLMRDQIKEPKELSGDKIFEASASAVRAARRAQLPIIALDGAGDDDFNAAIKKLLHLKRMP